MKKHMKKPEAKSLRASTTVEMACIMPLVLFVFLVIVYSVFYYHDKHVLNGIAYEAAIIGSEKAHKEIEDYEGQLEAYVMQQAMRKVILLQNIQPVIGTEERKVTVTIRAAKHRMRLAVRQQAVIIRPEKLIRETRKIKLPE